MTHISSKRSSFPDEVIEIIRTLKTHGFLGYVVGGAVRDLVRDLHVSDWDFATDATPDKLLRIFPKVIPTGIRHGTVTVVRGTSQYELTTFRTDGDYASQRSLARSCITRNIEEDLKHRDFTINAMAYDPLTDTLLDPFGGHRDLKRRIIRGVEDPLSRFMEDGLRTYRAFRFSVALDYRIERKTLKAIPLALEKVKGVSWERVREEILKILGAKKPSKAFEMMRRTGLLSIGLPELLEGYRRKHGLGGDIYHHILATVDAAPRRPMLRIACLLHDVGKPRTRRRTKAGYVFDGHERISAQLTEAVAIRLKLSNNQRKYISQLVENHGLTFQTIVRGPDLRRFLSRIDERWLDDFFTLSLADLKASGARQSKINRVYNLRKKCRNILKAGTPLTASQLAIKGDTVKEILGITEGVQVGRIMTQVLDMVLQDPRKNNPQDLARLVREIGQN
jgi:tRNA nucleotidyltransferase (CCA-adding enzyme)